MVLITLHYLSQAISYAFQLIGVFDRDEKYASLRLFNSVTFVLVRFSTVVIAILSLYYGVANTDYSNRGLLTLVGIFVLQGYMIFDFITEQLRATRERKREAQQKSSHAKKQKNNNKDKPKKKKESDLPEADQATAPSSPSKKQIKTK